VVSFLQVFPSKMLYELFRSSKTAVYPLHTNVVDLKKNPKILSKVNFNLSPCLTKYHTMKTCVGSRSIVPRIRNIDVRLRLNGQLHAPIALPLGKWTSVSFGLQAQDLK
jgi:hypothetical protein